MKLLIRLTACLFVLTFTPVFGQPATPLPKPLSAPQAPPPSGTFQERLQTIINRANPSQNQPPPLTQFNLDFPGGTPAELIKAIQKAMGKPLNAIIPTEDADIQLPPLKMNDVVTPQLFAALEAASRKTVTVQNGPAFGNSYSEFHTDFGFKTADGPVSDTSVWYFHAEKPNLPPVISSKKICRFYSLSPYLDRGFTVDDITTAIRTGWKMQGDASAAELNYHKETKLLIAFGEPNKLETIEQVLSTLPQTQYSLPTLDWQVKQLQIQLDQLKKKIGAVTPPPTVSPGEKSGK